MSLKSKKNTTIFGAIANTITAGYEYTSAVSVELTSAYGIGSMSDSVESARKAGAKHAQSVFGTLDTLYKKEYKILLDAILEGNEDKASKAKSRLNKISAHIEKIKVEQSISLLREKLAAKSLKKVAKTAKANAKAKQEELKALLK